MRSTGFVSRSSRKRAVLSIWSCAASSSVPLLRRLQHISSQLLWWASSDMSICWSLQASLALLTEVH